MLAMPLLSHPTTLLWIDDDTLFLEAAIESLGQQHPIQALHSADECLTFFNHYQSLFASSTFLQADKQHEGYDLHNHCPVDVNLNTMLDIRNNANRQHEISVMIVDYNMPGKTGIELCRELAHLPIKKILLTGEINHQHAVEAFNDGLIDCFLRKDSPTLVTDLIQHISKLKQVYFSQVTKSLLAHLEADNTLPASDSLFGQFFKNWCEENDVVEYYLVDKKGTFITHTNTGESRYFITHTDTSLAQFVHLYADDEEVKPFLQSIKDHRKFPFFGLNKEPWHIEFSQWDAYFYPFETLCGKNTYYWMALENNAH